MFVRGVGAKGSFFTLLAGGVELTKEKFTGEMHQKVSLLLTVVLKKCFYRLKRHGSKAVRILVLPRM